MNCATATGQLTGPLLLNAVDAPRYLPGVRSLMIAQVVLCVCVAAQVTCLFMFNKKRQAQRVAAGMPAIIHDTSMDRKFTQMDEKVAVPEGEVVDEDLTDWNNLRFVYVY
jgi:hypothetical protein